MRNAYTTTDLIDQLLTERGWTIAAKDWQASRPGPGGAVHVIAQNAAGILIAVEITSLAKPPEPGTPTGELTPRRVAQIRALLSRWLLETEGSFTQVRIDTATVYPLPSGEVGIAYSGGAA